MSMTIDGIEFDHHRYDAEGDVLYLSVGEPRVPDETDATPEGHAIDVDADGNVIGMIIVNFRFLVDRDGELRITWPDGHLSRDSQRLVDEVRGRGESALGMAPTASGGSGGP